MLSLKRLSDAFDEAKKQVVEQYLSTGKSRSDEGFISGVIVRSVSSHSPHTSTVKLVIDLEGNDYHEKSITLRSITDIPIGICRYG